MRLDYDEEHKRNYLLEITDQMNRIRLHIFRCSLIYGFIQTVFVRPQRNMEAKPIFNKKNGLLKKEYIVVFGYIVANSVERHDNRVL